MGVYSKFLLFKGKKSLGLVAVGLLLAAGSADAVVTTIRVDNNRTSTVSFDGSVNNLDITNNGSISVVDANAPVYTDKLIGHFILNDGNISTTVESSNSTVEAAGIYIEGNVADANITNNGTISTAVKSNNSQAHTAGIYIDIDVNRSNITNSGTITTSATAENNSSSNNYSGAEAYGIYADNLNNSTITNSGTITTSATTENNSSGAWVYTYGIYADNLNNSTITNSSTITASSTAESNSSGTWAGAYGIYADEYVTDFNITNSGDITATAENNNSSNNGSGAEAYGIYAEDDVTNSTITNSGTITASSTAESNSSNTWAEAYGILAYNLSNSNITNSGTITTSATTENNSSGAWVYTYGIYADNLNNSTITNSSTITASSTAESNSSNTWAEAYGILAYNLSNSNITNSGTITTSATAESNSSVTWAEAYGILAYNLSNSNITNSGTITTSATAESNSSGTWAGAAGIYAHNLNNSTITNSGTITAKVNNELDKNGYSVYVYDSSDANSTITNTKTGKLYGNLYIKGDAKVINKGLVALPYNTKESSELNPENSAYIGGDFTNSGTIQIAMKTDGNITNTQYSQLVVAGSAVFNAGSTIDVNVLATSTNTKLLIGQKLDNVVSAGTLTINDLKVTDNSQLLDFEYIKDGNNIDLNITKGATIADSTAQGTSSVNTTTTQEADVSNAVTAATTLDTIQNGGIPSGLEKFYEKLNTLGSAQEVAKAVDSTLPYTTVSSINIFDAILGNIFGIVDNQGVGGLNSGDALFSERKLWLKPFGNFGKQNDKGGIHGFDFHTAGVGIGAQGEYSNNAYAGIAFFYNRANVDVNKVDQSSDLDIYTALVYGQTPIANSKARLAYKASASWQKTKSTRYIPLTNETAKANYTSNLYAIDLRVEKDIQINNKLLLIPHIGATYKYIHTPSYKESGASVDLSVDSLNTKTFTAYMGAKAFYKIDTTSSLYGAMNVGYDIVNDDIALISAYSAAPNSKFTTKGINNGRLSYSAAIGYRKDITNLDNINFRYEFDGEGSSYHNNAFALKYSHKF